MGLILKKMLLSSLFILQAQFCFANETAQLVTSINILQNSKGLHFDVQLENTKIARGHFFLSKDAIIISFSGFELTDESHNAQAYEFKSTVENVAKISYEMPLDQSQVQYLIEESNWYPRSDDIQSNQIFRINTVSDPGVEIIHSATMNFQSGVSTVIGKFIKYESLSKKIIIYLQKADQMLASTLIASLDLYLKNNEINLGPYPYESFSVVETSDEIGYAFPRMTWIGSKLLRFPFILKSSLPHELLHSWWGNSVFVDYASGNWCEGLTVFGADYALLSENERILYRQKALLEYVDYVKKDKEITLSEFVSREEDRSLQAIGYNKSLMMFVMLEQIVGVDVFAKALKEFYSEFKLLNATYADLFNIIKNLVGATDSIAVQDFYDFWIMQKGAIVFESVAATSQAKQSGYLATFLFPAIEVSKMNIIPIQIQIAFSDGSKKNFLNKIIDNKIEITLDKEPVGYALDPEFKLFRTLSEQERPTSFSKIFATPVIQSSVTSDVQLTFPQVFPNSILEPINFLQQDFDIEGLLLIQNYQGGSLAIDQALSDNKIQINSDSITLGEEAISLIDNAYFVSVKVRTKTVVLFKLNQSLPPLRWLQRWSHYGAQGYLVLSPIGSVKQGVWDGINYKKFN
ncbi:MAG: M1 family aminopeptidase [Pseudobdellovibrio sp.]